MLSAPRLYPLLDWIAASLPSAAAAGARACEERRFPAYDGGCVAFDVPRGWREEIVISAASSQIVFRSPARRGAVVVVSVLPMTPAESLAFSIERMRQEVEQAARAACAAAIEPIAGRFGGGFCFSVHRPGAALGLGRRVQGRFLVRPLVLDFRIDAAPRSCRRLLWALGLVKSARLAGRGAARPGAGAMDTGERA